MKLETRASCCGSFPPLFLEKENIRQITLKRTICLSNKKFEILSFENYGFSDKPETIKVRNQDEHLKLVRYWFDRMESCMALSTAKAKDVATCDLGGSMFLLKTTI